MIQNNKEPKWTYMGYSYSPPQFINPYSANFYGYPYPTSLFPATQPPLSSPLPPQENIVAANNETPLSIENGAVIQRGPADQFDGKKGFKKDKKCPVGDCRRKYSSKIALRAHLRRQHPRWMDETSDYQP